VTLWHACRFYWGLSIASIVLYFVTSSDSGSLVIDCLTANGNPRPPVMQRIFWSFSEGAVAMGLLRAGGATSLQALQAVSIIAGAPYTVVICLMCVSLWTVLSEEYDRYYNIHRHVYHEWVSPLLDVLDYSTFRREQAVKTLLAVVAPWYYAAHGAAWADGVSDVYYQVVYFVLFNGWIVLLAANAVLPGLWALSWVLYVAFAAHMAYERGNLRDLRVRLLPAPSSLAGLCCCLLRLIPACEGLARRLMHACSLVPFSAVLLDALVIACTDWALCALAGGLSAAVVCAFVHACVRARSGLNCHA
jgi:hypothetical protein